MICAAFESNMLSAINELNTFEDISETILHLANRLWHILQTHRHTRTQVELGFYLCFCLWSILIRTRLDRNLNSLLDTNAANSDTQLTKSLSLHKNLKRSAKFSAWRFGFSVSSLSSAGVCVAECVCEPEMKPIAQTLKRQQKIYCYSVHTHTVW